MAIFICRGNKHRSCKRNWPEVETRLPVIDSLERLLDTETLI